MTKKQEKSKKRKKLFIISGIIVLFFVIWTLIKLPICPVFSPLNPVGVFSCTLIELVDLLYRALFGFRGLLT